ncbi:MAG: contractile injection system protein, VgrG/Pvc8 family [Pseudomonadota bacterium]
MPEAILAPTAIYSARPIIEIDRRRPPIAQQLLLEMDMRETEGGLSSLELRFINIVTHERGGVDFAFEHSGTDLFPLGNEIRVFGGDEGDPVEIFAGTISAVEFLYEEDGQPELCIHAEDALMESRMQRFTRSHPAGPLRDIVENVALDTGLRANISGLTDSVDIQIQLNESNLAFLRRLLVDYDADLQVVHDELHVSPRGDVERGSVTLAVGGQLTRIRLCADLSDQVSKVTHASFDVAQGRQLTAESVRVDLGPGSGRTGSDWLEQARGSRDEHLAERPVYDQAQADALVNAAYSRRSRRFVTAEGTCEGNPALRVGTHVNIEGVGPRFENTYYVTSVCHRFDRSVGYQTDFTAECGYFGG